ncbi:MAG: SdrD B-like domain-containing protein, partial [Bacteroidota bacterium]
FLDLAAAPFSNDFGTEPIRDLLSADNTAASTDSAAFTAVGKMGIGDIDIDVANDQLYLTNLETNELVRVDLSNYVGPGAFGAATAGDVTSFNIPDPGCSGGLARVWATKVRGDKVYVGVVCDANSSRNPADLRAFVYEFDIVTEVFNTTPVLDIPLTYARGSAATNIDIPGQPWQPWEDDIQNFNVRGFFEIHPQPILSDIAFDIDGSMVIAIMDRASALQIGNADNYPDGTAPAGERAVGGGDILRAAAAGNGFVLENNGMVNGISGAGVGNFQGPGFGEFYDDNFFNEISGVGTRLSHAEIGLGAVAIAPGSGQLITTVVDPNNSITFSIGIRGLDNTTGQIDFGYTIFRGNSGGGQSNFGKGGGLGDVELLCPVQGKIEIGNYVWVDFNLNGVQDPCEMPIDGVPVSLYNKDDGQFEAVTTTANGGQYYFSDVAENTNYAIVFGYDYTSAASDGLWDPTEGKIILDDLEYGITIAEAIESATSPTASELNDSDASLMDMAGLTQYPIISYTTGDSTDHNQDLGLTPSIDYGDLPDFNMPGTYATNLNDGGEGAGAAHLILPNFEIGPTIDDELDGQPGTTALDDGADEDGVTLPETFYPGQTGVQVPVSVMVPTGTNAQMFAWID